MCRVIPWAGLVACCAVAVVGCGPINRPIPERLSDESQKQVDDAWNAALTPVGKHDHQTWLDVLIGTYAYQIGVDQLEFRSVKRWTGGTVVMEAKFDRAKPAEDRFTVMVNDQAGKPLRTERYTREEVERTARELTPPNVPDTDPAMVAYKARMANIEAVLPKAQAEKAK